MMVGAGGVERIVEIKLRAPEKARFDRSVATVRGLVQVTRRLLAKQAGPRRMSAPGKPAARKSAAGKPAAKRSAARRK